MTLFAQNMTQCFLHIEYTWASGQGILTAAHVYLLYLAFLKVCPGKCRHDKLKENNCLYRRPTSGVLTGKALDI